MVGQVRYGGNRLTDCCCLLLIIDKRHRPAAGSPLAGRGVRRARGHCGVVGWHQRPHPAARAAVGRAIVVAVDLRLGMALEGRADLCLWPHAYEIACACSAQHRGTGQGVDDQ